MALTNEEAIKILSVNGWGYTDGELKAATQMAKDALEKQTPVPPQPDPLAKGIDGKPVPRCKMCGYALDLRIEQYCPCCGQRLTKWSEVED